MSDKIEYNDLFAPDAFTKAIEGMNGVLNAFKELQAEMKQSLTTQKQYFDGFKPKSFDDIKKLNQEIKNTEKTLREYTAAQEGVKQSEIQLQKLEQERLKTQKLQQQVNNANERSLNKLNGEYSKGVRALSDLKKQLKELEFTGRTNGKLYRSLSNEFKELDSKVRKAEKSVGEFQRNVGNYPKVIDTISAKLAGAFSIGAIANFTTKVIQTRAEFQKFEAVLTNTLGSNSRANDALKNIQTFASTTPFGVKELTEDFVKLVNTGFEPTNAELTKLGDLASSQGKSFDQLTEALIDAQTGEFERLKEFGIRAKKEGDKVTLSFKDQKVQVDNNNESIRKAILGFGELQGVAGGMAAISDTLGGKISNLGDNFDAFFNNLGESSEGVFASVLDGFNALLSKSNETTGFINELNKSLKGEGVELTFIERLSGSAKILGGQFKAFTDDVKKSANETNNFAKGVGQLQEQQKVLNELYQSGEIDIRTYEINAAILRDGIKDLTESSAAYTKKLTEQTTATP